MSSQSSSNPISCATASSLELWLITVAVGISYFLSALPIKASSKLYEKGRRPLIFSFCFILIATAAISLGLTTLILGHTNKISLDAIAAIIFALIPGLVSFPRDAFTDLFVDMATHHFCVFPVYKKFAYVTMGRPCRHGKRSGEDPIPNCDEEQCEAKLYIRQLQPKRTMFWWKRRDGYLSHKRWDSVVRDHTRGVVTLQNSRPVLEQEWYLRLSRSVWFVMQPWLVGLSTPTQVGQALRLVADILAIGRLVLRYRGDAIKRELRDFDICTDPMKKSAVDIGKALAHEIGLTEWAEVDTMQVRQFCDEDTRGREGEFYNVLFYYLIVRSHLFRAWSKWEREQEEWEEWEDEEEEEYDEAKEQRDEELGVRETSSEEENMQEEQSETVQKVRKDPGRNQLVGKTTFVSTLVKWAAVLINNQAPFRDPKRVAEFKYVISGARIIEELGRTKVSGEELERVILGKVDAWLRFWGCDVDSWGQD